jgi:hypothetical protein
MHDSAVGEDGGRGHITRTVAGKESDDARNLFRTRHAPVVAIMLPSRGTKNMFITLADVREK